MTVRAIYENGVIRLTKPLDLPDNTAVEVEITAIGEEEQETLNRRERARKAVLEILSRSYDTGQSDAAARHDEHQP